MPTPSHAPRALRLPAPHDLADAPTWADAAARLAATWPAGEAPPTAGQLAAVAAIQLALDAAVADQGVAGADARDLVDHVVIRRVAWLRQLGDPPRPAPKVREAAARDPLHGRLAEALDRPLRDAADPSVALGRLLSEWGWLPGPVRRAARHALDLLAEERRPRGAGPGPVQASDPVAWAGDPGYRDDRPWMTRLVHAALLARVWLRQLEAWYGVPVARLDQIPDAALRDLARDGATALWLVGIWERSPASARIKQLRGQPDAAASAYALVEHAVAADLGGDEALDHLARRARAAGLRLCADVVPNHTGLDSRWMVEHPDWFVQTDAPPFPGYTFDGPDLSGDPRIQVFLEDGYWRGDDAAVVFKRVDAATGEVRYIYHGNDGTSMPWNDTAQLDITLPEVRRAMIEVAVGLARRFDVLRFDAAMALARRHVRRLWYPDPGEGGAIPSRAGRGLSEAEWARRMPAEFWSELSEALSRRAPDTLLLAEAFWMMEADFVRRFGIHRVYWSAFRDWIRDGDHRAHKAWLARILAREPRHLGHLCLYLSNPDEAPAAEVFGTGDRALAAAALQAVLPGLPLLAHGQVGGLRERYGMEFTAPRRDEAPDPALVARHRARIAPLLRRRALFGGAGGFRLFEVRGDHGDLDPVYAVVNRDGDRRALVVINCSPLPQRGRVTRALPTRGADGATRDTLPEALGLAGAPFIALDDLDGRTVVRRASDLAARGLEVDLGPWEVRAFLDPRAHAGVDVAPVQARAPQGHGAEAPPGRRAGVLLHPTSLWGREPTGTLGDAARFVDWLAAAGLRTWQVLPLGRPGPGGSPYSSPTSRLGDPALIDLDALVREGWLHAGEVELPPAPAADRVGQGAFRRAKAALLERAADRFLGSGDPAFDAWREARPWLVDDLLFAVLSRAHGGRPWWTWPDPERFGGPASRRALVDRHRPAVDRAAVLAWWFDRQWDRVRANAEAVGVELVGDLPMYVAHDSAEVWTRPHLFDLDPTGRPRRVAGVPPDAFAEAGQRWGNPLYRWERHAADGYRWWIHRFRRARAWTPVLRIDHFRGFAAYYAIPADAPDARGGTWEPGPGRALFDAVRDALGPAPAIAEDLGTIDAAVDDLRRATGMWCTRVLQFGVGAGADSPHNPARIAPDTAVYTGTHDNDTTIGWFRSLDDDRRGRVAMALGARGEREVVDRMIALALSLPAARAIVPMQDWLRLGPGARMNRPGTADGNWAWRMTAPPSEALAARARSAVAAAGRLEAATGPALSS